MNTAELLSRKLLSDYKIDTMVAITDISAHEILNSQGNPTVEATVILADGSQGTASVPSGTSTGYREALEYRDQDPKRYQGKGVLKSVHIINTLLRAALTGQNALDQTALDAKMKEADGTSNKAKLGANTLLAVSLANARAAANAQKQALYEYIAKLSSNTPVLLPVPMFNILNGGVHANNNLTLQEFMVLPVGAPNFKEALRWGVEIFHTLRDLLKKSGLPTQVGDEGGFAPNLRSHTEAIELILTAIHQAGYTAGKDIFLGLDAASSEFYQEGIYLFENKQLDATAWQSYLINWAKQYPIISIEDGMAENDMEGWENLTRAIGDQVQLVGDDLFVTHANLLAEGISAHRANAILIKPNQVGTLSETLEAIKLAKDSGYAPVISHRSGETEDTFIADLAIGTCSPQIKTGSLCRSERTAKFNQMLRIEAKLKDQAHYLGLQAFQNVKKFQPLKSSSL